MKLKAYLSVTCREESAVHDVDIVGGERVVFATVPWHKPHLMLIACCDQWKELSIDAAWNPNQRTVLCPHVHCVGPNVNASIDLDERLEICLGGRCHVLGWKPQCDHLGSAKVRVHVYSSIIVVAQAWRRVGTASVCRHRRHRSIRPSKRHLFKLYQRMLPREKATIAEVEFNLMPHHPCRTLALLHKGRPQQQGGQPEPCHGALRRSAALPLLNA
mmetsp:Transcript_26988/g.57187  ORF Transcript_26988/g.57187 Transcript_26988/m.57187 type:complete len:216 (-) Transcript_26988:8-655(-)